jgi:hypothetical protein
MNQYLIAATEAVWIVGFFFALFMVYAGSWQAMALGMAYIGGSLAIAVLFSRRSRVTEGQTAPDKRGVNQGNDV